MHVVQLHCEGSTYAEVRSIQNMGHGYFNTEAANRMERHKEIENQFYQLKKKREEEGVTKQQHQELEARYRELWTEYEALLP